MVELSKVKDKKPLADLYGVGVGSGAPDLLTLRALDVLHKVDRIFVPKSSKYRSSVAWRTVEEHLQDVRAHCTELFFPMTKDSEIVEKGWQKIRSRVSEALEANEHCALITQGDPMLYSSFIYLMDYIRQSHPHKKIEIVPAVSCITAVAAQAQIPLVDGKETLAILPATYDPKKLEEVLPLFDTILLTKVSQVLATVIDILRKHNLLDRATYIRRATMPEGERIIRHLPDALQDQCDYFSVVLIKKTGNERVLFQAQAKKNN